MLICTYTTQISCIKYVYKFHMYIKHTKIYCFIIIFINRMYETKKKLNYFVEKIKYLLGFLVTVINVKKVLSLLKISFIYFCFFIYFILNIVYYFLLTIFYLLTIYSYYKVYDNI